MIDEKIHVAVKSFGRAGKVTTTKVVPFAWVWVPESQEEEYRKHHGARVITIPDKEDGNLCKKLNAILDRSPCEWTLILDDDIRRIGVYEGGQRYWLGSSEVEWMICHFFDLADQMGVKLWGINQAQDPLFYVTYTPFSFLSPILGPFGAHLSPILRYDERMNFKEDYDFWLQNIRQHRKTLRVNKYHYIHDHGKMSGGQVSMRTVDIEQEGIRRMEAKWGRVYRGHGTAGGKGATGKNYLNSCVKVPIKGI